MDKTISFTQLYCRRNKFRINEVVQYKELLIKIINLKKNSYEFIRNNKNIQIMKY